jgi:signal transduction histidine kinase
VAAVIAASVTALPWVRDSIREVPAFSLIGVAIAAGLAIPLFPWDRHHPNWFLVVGVAASLHIGAFMWATGGAASPFWPFVVFVVLAATAYYSDAWPIAVLSLLAACVLVSPLLYTGELRPAFLADLVARVAIVGFSFLVGRLLFRGLEHAMSLSSQVREQHELLARQREFVRAVAHELRNPLSVIAGYGDLLQRRQDLSEQARTLVQRQRSGWERMKRLVADLDEFNRLDVGIKVQVGPIDIGPVVRECMARAQEQAGKHTIRTQMDDGLPTAMADSVRLGQVLDNLLLNAIKYSPEGGFITVSCTADGGMLRLNVEDEGLGIPSEHQEKLFTAFYRAARPEISGIPGTGLGLTICRAIVEAHGGRIWVQSAPGRGSTFTFTVPTAVGSEKLG